MTLHDNKFWNLLLEVYGNEYRILAPEDSGYTYAHLWRFATGGAPIPQVLSGYLNAQLRIRQLEQDVKRLKKKLPKNPRTRKL